MCDPTQRRRWPTDETITCLYALGVCDLINSKARDSDKDLCGSDGNTIFSHFSISGVWNVELMSSRM